MTLDRDTCYRALRARDARFDGRFFTGVTSTGVYCRPICPARTPRAENCVFFACAAAAEEAGFRACRRCRPDSAPGTPVWEGTSTTVARALRLIEEGALDRFAGDGDGPGDGGPGHGDPDDRGGPDHGASPGLEALAGRLGVGGRHLRRLFAEHLGASPMAVAMTRRAHFGRRLLEQTDLPVIQVAGACGFGSLRRFNAAIRRAFALTPTEIRRAARRPASRAAVGGAGGPLTLRLPARPPLDWDRLLAYLAPRLIPGVEAIHGRTYRRLLDLEGEAVPLAVTAAPGDEAVLLQAPAAAAPLLADLAGRARRLFDLETDAAAIAAHLGDDPALRERLAAGALCRLPGCWDRFEMAVRAILGQQVSVAAALTLCARLVHVFGREGRPDDPGWLFPAPATLAAVSADRLAGALKLPRARAAGIRALAAAVAAGEPVLEPAASLEQAVGRLVALPGIGPWTAHYVALRALREPDAIPVGDLGLRRALAGPAGEPLTAGEFAARAEAWRPWRGYGAIVLWSTLPAPTSGRN